MVWVGEVVVVDFGVVFCEGGESCVGCCSSSFYIQN